MTKALRIVLVAVLLVALAAAAQAQEAKKRPIQLAIFTPIQLFPAQDNISGIRLNLIYSKNASVTGLDWGLVNHTTTGVSKGVQFGFIGLADGGFVGWQNNWINTTKANFEGFQWGVVNYANYCNGFQLGLVNYARKMKGLQIGLVNIIKQGGQFPVFPIVNWSF